LDKQASFLKYKEARSARKPKITNAIGKCTSIGCKWLVSNILWSFYGLAWQVIENNQKKKGNT
jgi:hypothetical protein